MSFVEESGHETNEIDSTVGGLCNHRGYAVHRSSADISKKAFQNTITRSLQPVPV
jgi:hypothetical protein